MRVNKPHREPLQCRVCSLAFGMFGDTGDKCSFGFVRFRFQQTRRSIGTGYRFGVLKPYKRGKWREKAISWILEQFEKGTLKPLRLRHGLENVEIE